MAAVVIPQPGQWVWKITLKRQGGKISIEKNTWTKIPTVKQAVSIMIEGSLRYNFFIWDCHVLGKINGFSSKTAYIQRGKIGLKLNSSPKTYTKSLPSAIFKPPVIIWMRSMMVQIPQPPNVMSINHQLECPIIRRWIPSPPRKKQIKIIVVLDWTGFCSAIIIPFVSPTRKAFRCRPVFFEWVLDSTCY